MVHLKQLIFLFQMICSLLLWWFQWSMGFRCPISSGTCCTLFKEEFKCRKATARSCNLGRRKTAPSSPPSLTLHLQKQLSTDSFNDCQLLWFTDSFVPKMGPMCYHNQWWKHKGEGDWSKNSTLFSFSLFFFVPSHIMQSCFIQPLFRV